MLRIKPSNISSLSLQRIYTNGGIASSDGSSIAIVTRGVRLLICVTFNRKMNEENLVESVGYCRLSTSGSKHNYQRQINNINDKCKTIYLGHDVLPTGEQLDVINFRKIKINIIPDYYYGELGA